MNKTSSVSFDSERLLIKGDNIASEKEVAADKLLMRQLNQMGQNEQLKVERVENSNESQMDDFMIGDSDDQIQTESYYDEEDDSDKEQKKDPIHISFKNIQNENEPNEKMFESQQKTPAKNMKNKG